MSRQLFRGQKRSPWLIHLSGKQPLATLLSINFARETSNPSLFLGMILQFGLYSYILGGGFKYFLFSPLFGEMIQFDQYFSNGLNPPTSIPLDFPWDKVAIQVIQHPRWLINHLRLSWVIILHPHPLQLGSWGFLARCTCGGGAKTWCQRMGLDVCLANGHVSKGEFVGRVRGLVEMRTGWYSEWWFQIFFIFNPTWGNDPIWLIFFNWVETTN